jgi:hypothetical protein
VSRTESLVVVTSLGSAGGPRAGDGIGGQRRRHSERPNLDAEGDVINAVTRNGRSPALAAAARAIRSRHWMAHAPLRRAAQPGITVQLIDPAVGGRIDAGIRIREGRAVPRAVITPRPSEVTMQRVSAATPAAMSRLP